MAKKVEANIKHQDYGEDTGGGFVFPAVLTRYCLVLLMKASLAQAQACFWWATWTKTRLRSLQMGHRGLTTGHWVRLLRALSPSALPPPPFPSLTLFSLSLSLLFLLSLSVLPPEAWPSPHQPHSWAFLHWEINPRACDPRASLTGSWPHSSLIHPALGLCAHWSSSSQEMVGLAWEWASQIPHRKEFSWLGRGSTACVCCSPSEVFSHTQPFIKAVFRTKTCQAGFTS